MRKHVSFLLALIATGLLLAAPPAANAEEAEKRFDIPIGISPVRGTSGAPVTIIEFLDFQ